MRLSELQDNTKKIKKLKSEGLPKGWDDIKKMFHYQMLLYISNNICSKLINKYYDNILTGHFEIKKLIVKKYY